MNIEEFVNAYLQEHLHDVLLNPYNGLVEFAEAFKEHLAKTNDHVHTTPFRIAIQCVIDKLNSM